MPPDTQLQELNNRRAAAARVAQQCIRHQLAAQQAEAAGQAGQAHHHRVMAARIEGRPEPTPPTSPTDPAAEAQAVQTMAIQMAHDLGIRAGVLTGRVMERNRR